MFNDDVWRYAPLGPAPTLALGTIGLAVLIALSLMTGRAIRVVARWLLGVATVVVLAATLGRSYGSTANLVPGRAIRDELIENVNHALGVMNVVGNVALFVPLGWLIVVAVRRSVGVAALGGAALSLLVEIVQAFVGRAPDVDDVILNTAGAVLGGLAGYLLLAVGAARRNRFGVDNV